MYARTTQCKRSYFSSYTSFNTCCGLFLFAFFIAVFYLEFYQFHLHAESKSVDLNYFGVVIMLPG